MRWSWRIARVSGIGIYVHFTFLLLPLWIGAMHYAVRRSWGDAWAGVGFVLILFAFVVLHELGHAVTAGRFGIRTRDITLLPIGGVARLERIPEKPKQELLVALAGPAVNVCLAVLCFALLGAGRQLAELTNLDLAGGRLLANLLWVNVALVIFNLVPAFPMDGGRVLRALLAMRLNYVRATNIAARIGQFIALIFGFVGLLSLFFGSLVSFSNPFLLVIGLFIWVGASQEAALVQVRAALEGVPVSRLLITEVRTLSPRESLSAAATQLLSGWQQDFPVVDEGRLVGLLTRTALVDGLAARGPEALVGQSMLRHFPTIDPEESAEAAWLRLRTGDGPMLLAEKDGEFFGVATSQNVGEFMLLRAALSGQTWTAYSGTRLAGRGVSQEEPLKN